MVFLQCCNIKEDLAQEVDSSLDMQKTDSPYLIDEGTAISYLNGFLNYGEDTKTMSTKSVKEIFSIELSRIRTKGYPELPEDYQKLFYIVNFEDEEGFALLAADKRMPYKVLYVIEEGSYSDEEFYASLSDYSLATKTQLSNSSGIIYQEIDDSTEMFMDVDNFIPYNSSLDDCCIGNYIADSLDILDIDAYTSKEVMGPINNLAVTASLAGEKELGHLPTAEDFEKLETTETTTTTTVLKNTEKLLDFTSKWHQRSPYNDFCPKVRKFLVFGNRKKAPCGCFPLSVAKIMTKFECPDIMTYNGHVVDWKSMRSTTSTDTRNKSAAALLRGIEVSCDSWYFYQGTFTFPYKVVNYMSNIGFKNVDEVKYNTSKVTSMLDSGCPVIISAIPDKVKVTKAHAWTIDAYKKTRIQTDTKYYRGGVYRKTETTYETSTMVHCNFGWGGKNDGYFVSGIFDLDSRDVNLDKPSLGTSDEYYNGRIRIIVYGKPN